MATRQQASSSRRASQLSQQRTAALPPLDTRGEMFQRGQQGSFFDMKALAPRPMSTSTEIFDTDFEDDDSEIDEAEYSPRVSINSVCVPARRRVFLVRGRLLICANRPDGGARPHYPHLRTCRRRRQIASMVLTSNSSRRKRRGSR